MDPWKGYIKKRKRGLKWIKLKVALVGSDHLNHFFLNGN